MRLSTMAMVVSLGMRGAPGSIPIDHMGDGMVANLEAAVALAGGLDLFDVAGRRGFETAFDVGMKGRLVIIDCQQIVVLGVEDRLGDGGIAPSAGHSTRLRLAEPLASFAHGVD